MALSMQLYHMAQNMHTRIGFESSHFCVTRRLHKTVDCLTLSKLKAVISLWSLVQGSTQPVWLGH